MKQLIMKIVAIGLLSAGNVQASAFMHVISEQNSEGSIAIYVKDEGESTEQWRFDVVSFADSQAYQFIFTTSSAVLTMGSSDISGHFTGAGSTSSGTVTMHTPEFPGVQLHSSGQSYFPPGTRPPTHVQGDSGDIKWPIDFNGQVRVGCVGAALTAIGTYIGSGAGIRSAFNAFVRGSIGGTAAAGAVFGLGSLMMGATFSAIDACANR